MLVNTKGVTKVKDIKMGLIIGYYGFVKLGVPGPVGVWPAGRSPPETNYPLQWGNRGTGHGAYRGRFSTAHCQLLTQNAIYHAIILNNAFQHNLNHNFTTLRAHSSFQNIK